MWWKVYFILISLFNIFFLYDYLQNLNWTSYDLAEFISLIIAEVGLFAYVFKKKYFSLLFWKIFFWGFIVNNAASILYFFTPLRDSTLLRIIFKSNVYQDTQINFENKLVCIFCMSLLVFFLPSFYALYRLGYPKK